jgi:hypothetical protein
MKSLLGNGSMNFRGENESVAAGKWQGQAAAAARQADRAGVTDQGASNPRRIPFPSLTFVL